MEAWRRLSALLRTGQKFHAVETRSSKTFSEQHGHSLAAARNTFDSILANCLAVRTSAFWVVVMPALEFIHDSLGKARGARDRQVSVLSLFESAGVAQVLKSPEDNQLQAMMSKDAADQDDEFWKSMVALKDALADIVSNWEFWDGNEINYPDVVDPTWVRFWSAMDAAEMFSDSTTFGNSVNLPYHFTSPKRQALIIWTLE